MSLRTMLLPLLVLLGCERGFADSSRATARPTAAEAPLHAVEVHVPSTTGVVDTPLTDVHGAPIGVPCATCHSGDNAARIVAGQGAPEAFHTGVELAHGPLSCESCHDPEDRSLLRLADGKKLAFTATMDLCSQCHGPQRRDYDHGAHGGMTGHWDLRAGGRQRASCVDCHAAHSPAIEPVTPVLPPQDRFASVESAHE